MTLRICRIRAHAGVFKQQKPGFPQEPEPKIDLWIILKENQVQMQNEVNRLFDLAQELKN